MEAPGRGQAVEVVDLRLRRRARGGPSRARGSAAQGGKGSQSAKCCRRVELACAWQVEDVFGLPARSAPPGPARSAPAGPQTPPGSPSSVQTPVPHPPPPWQPRPRLVCSTLPRPVRCSARRASPPARGVPAARGSGRKAAGSWSGGGAPGKGAVLRMRWRMGLGLRGGRR